AFFSLFLLATSMPAYSSCIIHGSHHNFHNYCKNNPKPCTTDDDCKLPGVENPMCGGCVKGLCRPKQLCNCFPVRYGNSPYNFPTVGPNKNAKATNNRQCQQGSEGLYPIFKKGGCIGLSNLDSCEPERPSQRKASKNKTSKGALPK